MDENSVLSKYARQPKIFIGLPSKGKWYKTNPLDKSGTGELPIYSMTAKDEIYLRTPDALMNGEATAASIKSACPLIENPHEIPMVDLDAILIAIRIATYGEVLKLEAPVPGTEEVLEVPVDLRTILDKLLTPEWQEECRVGELTFLTQPLKYRDQTIYDQKQFNTDRIIQALRGSKPDSDEAKKMMQQAFDDLTDNNLDLICKQVFCIKTPDGEESNPSAIREFFLNTDKKTFDSVAKHLREQKKKFDIPPHEIETPQYLVEQGAKPNIKVPLVFNQSNFFVLG